MDSKLSKQRDWVAQHTLSKQELRELIFEKIERARLLQSAEKNRRRTEQEPA